MGEVQRMNLSDEDMIRYSNWLTNRAMTWSNSAFILIAYCLLIIIGATGNSLVIASVIRNTHMKTARNMLIVNLAVSDLTLCLVTMPFSLVEIITKHWTLGALLCKFSGMLQAVSVFVSTLTITAIAIDRYKLILYPTSNEIKGLGISFTVVMIWTISVLMAFPLFMFRTLKHDDINLPGLRSVYTCWERWPFPHGRAMYSILTMLFQYTFPIVILMAIHFRICNRLRNRVNERTDNQRNQASAVRIASRSRRRKTSQLLLAIACIFAISWLPLNVLNLTLDMGIIVRDRETFNIVFAVCHMIGISSACSNPILYGWLNENFHKEFIEIFRIVSCKRSSAMTYGKCQNSFNYMTHILRKDNIATTTITYPSNGGTSKVGHNVDPLLQEEEICHIQDGEYQL